MADQHTPDWLQSVGTLLGGAGVGGVLLEIVRRMLPKKKLKEDITETYVEKIRKDYDLLQKRFEVLEAATRVREEELERELRQERTLNIKQLQMNITLETENRLLRSRYHRIRSYAQMVILKLYEMLGQEATDAVIPNWVDEPIDGPTAGHRSLPSGDQD